MRAAAKEKKDPWENIWKAVTLLLIPGLGFLWHLVEQNQTETKNKIERAREEIKSKTAEVAQKAEQDRKKLREEFEKSREKVDRAQQLFVYFASDKPGEHRLAILLAIAYMRADQIPPEVIPLLAVYDPKIDNDVRDQLVDALQDLTHSPDTKPKVKELVDHVLVRMTANSTVKSPGGASDAEKELQQNVLNLSSAAAAAAAPPAAISPTDPPPAPSADNQAAQKTLDNLAPALVALASAESGNSRALEVLQKASLSKDTVESAISTLPTEVKKQLRPRVYIQIANKNQRDAAKNLQQKLTVAGYLSPGVEDAGKRGYGVPGILEVRYFDESSRPDAESILKILKDNGAKDGRISAAVPTASDLRLSQDIKSHFEVWFGKNSL